MQVQTLSPVSGPKTAHWLLLLLLAAALLGSATAQAAIRAERLQFPVWLVDDGQRQALRPGQTLEPGQRVATGAGGKVWLRMDDGARVKLGEQGDLALKAVSARPPAATRASGAGTSGGAQTGLFEAALDVLEGAFRYTSDKLNTRWRHDVQIGLGSTATIGIRGTDLWGRVGPEQQFVVLIEGQIQLLTDAEQPVQLDTPLQIYQAAERAVSTVEMAQVQALAPQTELDNGTGVQAVAGDFQLNLASYSERTQALAAQRRASAEGLATQVEEVTVEGKTWYRLVVGGLESLADAGALTDRLAPLFGFRTPWVSGV